MANDYATCTNHGPTTVVFPPGMACPYCSGLLVLVGDEGSEAANVPVDAPRTVDLTWLKRLALAHPGARDSVRSAVRAVPGVTGCLLVERDSDPGVVAIHICGGEGQKQAIAEAIDRWIPVGIATEGDAEVVVEGKDYERVIRFSYINEEGER